jgi:hypothetical protein
MIHTFIRPVGGALIGLAALGKVDPLLGALGALAAGGIALTSHGGKASARVALNVISPAENISNITVSTTEDVAAGGLAFLALKYPYAAELYRRVAAAADPDLHPNLTAVGLLPATGHHGAIQQVRTERDTIGSAASGA